MEHESDFEQIVCNFEKELNKPPFGIIGSSHCELSKGHSARHLFVRSVL